MVEPLVTSGSGGGGGRAGWGWAGGEEFCYEFLGSAGGETEVWARAEEGAGMGLLVDVVIGGAASSGAEGVRLAEAADKDAVVGEEGGLESREERGEQFCGRVETFSEREFLEFDLAALIPLTERTFYFVCHR